MINWVKKLTKIPGRLTSMAVEKVVCGSDEVWDDTFEQRQSDLNARFKAITDQEQVAINGGTAQIAGGPEDIMIGSGGLVTANAVAGYLSSFIRGNSEVVEIRSDIIFNKTVVLNGMKTVVYENVTNENLTITVPNSGYRTPDGEAIVIEVTEGGYGEVNIININGTIFARGC